MSFAAWITLITTVVVVGITGMIINDHWQKKNAPIVIITEFNSLGQIVNTLITKEYKVKDNHIEVIPLDSKEIYILKGSIQISQLESQN